MPVGCGPSGNTWPRCPPHAAHITSVRTMPKRRVRLLVDRVLARRRVEGRPAAAGVVLRIRAEELGAATGAAVRPGSKTWSYSPVNGRSVPFSRSTWYCSGVSSARHCSSVFLIFSTLYGLPTGSIVTASRSRRRVLLEEVADDRLLRRLDLVGPADGPRRRRRLDHLGLLRRLARDREHRVGERVERLLRLGLRRLDHQRLRDDEREVDRRRVEAVVHQPLGDVERRDAVLALQRARREHELVHAEPVERQVVRVLQPREQVVRVQHGDLRHLAEPRAVRCGCTRTSGRRRRTGR